MSAENYSSIIAGKIYLRLWFMPSRIKKRFLPQKKFDRIDFEKLKNQTRSNFYD
jgi:hypothetical protein